MAYSNLQHIQGISRNQLQVSGLVDTIMADNPAGFIDAFVGSINLKKHLSFVVRKPMLQVQKMQLKQREVNALLKIHFDTLKRGFLRHLDFTVLNFN